LSSVHQLLSRSTQWQAVVVKMNLRLKFESCFRFLHVLHPTSL